MTTCEVRRRFRTCGRSAVATCQYCGRTFCEQHGSQLTDGQEICGRSICQQKRAELERHFLYKETVAARNRERLCGVASCGDRIGGQCSKCRGFFCLRHVEERELEERRGFTVTRRPGSLCRHCDKRRRLWSKV